MDTISKISKKNLLRYAESIGGKQMYSRFNKALRDAHVHDIQELNKRQMDNVIDKLVSQGDFVLDKEKIKKLIDEKERRRQVYVKMAAEDEDKELGYLPIGLGGIESEAGGKGRYDYRQMSQSPKDPRHIAGNRAVSSIARLNQKNSAEKPKNTGMRTQPTSSIARINKI